MDTKKEALTNLSRELNMLVSGLDEMIVSGRITPADVPDDWDWLVKRLNLININAVIVKKETAREEALLKSYGDNVIYINKDK